MSKRDLIAEELVYLKDLVKHRDLDWAQVSGPTLRYMLACVNMNEVLAATEKMGTDSPLSTATQFRKAEIAKDDARRGARQ